MIVIGKWFPCPYLDPCPVKEDKCESSLVGIFQPAMVKPPQVSMWQLLLSMKGDAQENVTGSFTK